MRSYPAPTRHRWTVAIEFHDGTRIEGTSDEDVVDRWHRLSWSWPEVSREEFKRVRVEHARVVYGARLPWAEWLADEQFLDRLAEERCLTVIRK